MTSLPFKGEGGAPHESRKRKILMNTPENVRLREEAAARCTAKIKRKVLKKQARKARAEHHVRCCLEPGKKKANRKPLTELQVKGRRMAKITSKAL